MFRCNLARNRELAVIKLNRKRRGITSWLGDTPFIEIDLDTIKDDKVGFANKLKLFVGSDQDITDAVNNIVD